MSEPKPAPPEHRSEELYFLPCPFCWGKARMAAYRPKREHDTVTFLAAECTCCGARGPVSVGTDADKARRKWNAQFNAEADVVAIAEEA